ncbi:MAG: IS630 family transposase [Bacteroidia bacterium]
MNATFLSRLEQILALYMADYDVDRPVICFDERPCFLIGNTVEGLEMEAGNPKRENYAYEKHGSAAVLAAIEPKTGNRLAHVRRHRGKKEFAVFMKQLASFYPDAKKIVVVLDNLNTHNKATFYQYFDAQEAAFLADKFEFVFTPKGASWLNMIEIEFSALSRQCLDRRINRINTLAKEVLTYFKQRHELKIKINWKFDRNAARDVLNRHYTKINKVNIKYKKT